MGQQTSTIVVKAPRPSASRIVNHHHHHHLPQGLSSQMDVNNTKIGTAEKLGNGLFSTLDLNPGDPIIIIHKPLLLIAENQALHRVCANCFIEGGEGIDLEPCSSCGVVRFCSNACEKSSLRSEGSHKSECAFLKSQKPLEHSRAQISAQATTNTACGYSKCQSRKTTISCIGCKALNYCDKKCEDKDRSFHEQQCKDIQSQNLGFTLNKILPTAVRATIQLISHPKTLAKDSAFMELSSQEDELRKSQSKWDDILLQAHAVTSLLKWKPEYVKYALESLCRLSTNAFRVESNIGNGPIGLCLDPLLARANHRCHPNAAITFDGKRCTLRALSPIVKGEQIFISYIDETQRQEVRQATLAETWYFKCRCARCTIFRSIYDEFMRYPTISTPKFDKLVPYQATYNFAKARVTEEDPSTVTRLFSLLHVLRHIEATIKNAHKTHQNIDRRLDFLMKAIGNLNDFILLQRYAQQPLPMVLTEMYLIYLDKAEYISALIILMYLIRHADPINHPSPYHPQRVTRLLALQRLLKFLASYDPDILRRFAIQHGIPIAVLFEMDWVSACQMVLYVLREVGNKCWGEDSAVMRGLELDIRDVEDIQCKREDGKVGAALRDWGRGKNGTGVVYVERLGVGLRNLAGWVWNVVGVARDGAMAGTA
ncbi:hypothetical protein SBOR_5259 [Sclerotinia borealis F-4128]|uniref:Uncharacterized protein n=1 Tax=Sclerotinia borealis (strain F-4128) TaxID=1432307 RepID=W9CIL2_SCLBF|nr:hypothetical protein SBOR_5259 [Sclerotinia borealis F-4128]